GLAIVSNGKVWCRRLQGTSVLTRLQSAQNEVRLLQPSCNVWTVAIRGREVTTMANKSLFSTIVGKLLPKTDTVNAAGGSAYEFSPKHKLAQYAATGCLNSTFYAGAEEQLDTVLALCQSLPAEFIAKTALFARERGHMKDMPALLCAVLSVKAPGLLYEV